MLARITTQEARQQTDVNSTDWKTAGLIAKSVVRLSKVATIKKSPITRRLGTLSARDKAAVRRVWNRMF